MQLDRWPVGSFAHPQIEILALACLEEEDVVAVVQFRQLVELVQFRLGVELGILAAVWEERVEIIQQVSMSAGARSG